MQTSKITIAIIKYIKEAWFAISVSVLLVFLWNRFPPIPLEIPVFVNTFLYKTLNLEVSMEYFLEPLNNWVTVYKHHELE